MNHQALMFKMLIAFAHKSFNATHNSLKKIKETMKLNKQRRSYE